MNICPNGPKMETAAFEGCRAIVAGGKAPFLPGYFCPCFSATWMRIIARMSSTRAFS
jgi:hypothetical protein